MLALWQLLWSNVGVAAVLAVLAAGLGALCRRPALTHCLWLLVLLKLITPPLVPVTVVLPAAAANRTPPGAAEDALPRGVMPRPDLLRGPELPRVAQAPPPLAPLPARAEEEDPELAVAEIVQEVPDPFAAEEDEDLPPAAAAPPPADNATTPWIHALLAVWLASALAWYVVAGVRVRRFQRLLRHARAAGPALQAEVHALARKLGLRQGPTAWLVEGCVSPMVWAAAGRVRLLLPAGLMARLGEEQRATLLLHELAHLRRGDVWVRWLEMAVTGLYWWLPLLWWARRELRQAEEECCDAWVVRALPGAARAYARALVETVDFLSGAPPALPALASGVGPVHLLRRRLTMILRGTTSPKLTAFGLAALLATGALVPLLPTWAQSPDPQPQPRIGGGERERERGRDDKDLQRAEREVQQMERALKTMRDAQQKLHDKMAGYEQKMREAMDRLKAAHDKATQEPRAKGGVSENPMRGGGKGIGFGGGTMGGAKNADQRMRDVERKLDAVLRELQQLRTELKRGGRNTGGGGGQGGNNFGGQGGNNFGGGNFGGQGGGGFGPGFPGGGAPPTPAGFGGPRAPNAPNPPVPPGTPRDPRDAPPAPNTPAPPRNFQPGD